MLIYRFLLVLTIALGWTAPVAEAAESPAAEEDPYRSSGRSSYRLGNSLAVGGAGLAVAGVGGTLAISATCADEQHGCAYSLLGLWGITLLPAIAMIPAGEAFSYGGARRMGLEPWPVPHYVFLGGAASMGIGMLAMSSDDTTAASVLLYGGAALALTGAATQVVVNIGTFEANKRRTRLSAAPTMVGASTPGLALGGRF